MEDGGVLPFGGLGYGGDVQSRSFIRSISNGGPIAFVYTLDNKWRDPIAFVYSLEQRSYVGDDDERLKTVCFES